MTITELQQSKVDKLDQMSKLNESAEKENRDFNETEQKSYDDLKSEIESLNKRIARAQVEEDEKRKLAGKKFDKKNSNKEERDLAKFSFTRAARMASGKMDGLEAEMHQEGLKELRESGLAPSSENGIIIPQMILEHRTATDVTATGGTSGNQGGVAVATGLGSFIDALKDALVMKQLGADFMTGLVGNIDFPKESAQPTANWEGETDTTDQSSPTFSKLSMSPNRLATYVNVSNQLLMQTSPSIEARLRNQLVFAMQKAIDYAAINGSGESNQPEGILNTSGIGSVVGGTNGAAPTWDDLINLEAEIDQDNALFGKIAYLTNAKIRSKLKRTKLDSGSGRFVWENDNTVNGYKAVVSNLVPSTLTKGSATSVCSAILFGNFADVMIGQWGGIELLLDPYTQAKSGMKVLHVNTFADVLIARAESFAAMVDALTTDS